MYLHSLKVLRPMVKEMHSQENTIDPDPKIKWVKITQNVAECPLHHVTYVQAKFDVAISHG